MGMPTMRLRADWLPQGSGVALAIGLAYLALFVAVHLVAAAATAP